MQLMQITSQGKPAQDDSSQETQGHFLDYSAAQGS